MTTPNSPSAHMVDIHTDPEFADQFGTNVGDKILENLTVRDSAPAPRLQSCNVGRTDQKIRLITGAALVMAAALAPVNRGWRIAMAVWGASELITGSTRFCPVWKALGVNTCRGGER